MTKAQTQTKRIPAEQPVEEGNTAHHDLHGDTVPSAPEQAAVRRL
jgi:hypothetical protein